MRTSLAYSFKQTTPQTLTLLALCPSGQTTESFVLIELILCRPVHLS